MKRRLKRYVSFEAFGLALGMIRVASFVGALHPGAMNPRVVAL